MPDLSKPPSTDDDGDWIDAIEEAPCSVCGELIDDDRLEAMNRALEMCEDAEDAENLEGDAKCAKCAEEDEL